MYVACGPCKYFYSIPNSGKWWGKKWKIPIKRRFWFHEVPEYLNPTQFRWIERIWVNVFKLFKISTFIWFTQYVVIWKCQYSQLPAAAMPIIHEYTHTQQHVHEFLSTFRHIYIAHLHKNHKLCTHRKYFALVFQIRYCFEYRFAASGTFQYPSDRFTKFESLRVWQFVLGIIISNRVEMKIGNSYMCRMRTKPHICVCIRGEYLSREPFDITTKLPWTWTLAHLFADEALWIGLQMRSTLTHNKPDIDW